MLLLPLVLTSTVAAHVFDTESHEDAHHLLFGHWWPGGMILVVILFLIVACGIWLFHHHNPQIDYPNPPFVQITHVPEPRDEPAPYRAASGSVAQIRTVHSTLSPV